MCMWSGCQFCNPGLLSAESLDRTLALQHEECWELIDLKLSGICLGGEKGIKDTKAITEECCS